MADENKPKPFNANIKPLRGITLSKEDLVAIHGILSEKSKQAAELEIKNWIRPEDQSDEEFQKLSDDIRNAYRIHVSINIEGGGSLSNDSKNIFNDSSFPQKIISIEYDTGFIFKAVSGNHPRNKGFVKIDIASPKIFDVKLLPSFDTPNDSFIHIFGNDEDWVNSAYKKLDDFFMAKNNNRGWMHAQGIYDIFLFFVALPLVFWGLYKISPYIPPVIEERHEILRYVLYVYIFLMSLIVARFTFQYIKWIWKLNILKKYNESSRIHILVISGIAIGLAQDIVRSIFHTIIG